jgi:hypothetical protein
MRIGRTFKTLAFRRGVVRHSRGWLVVWLVLSGLSWLRTHAGKTEIKTVQLVLHPGDRYLVSNLPPEEQ